MSTETIHADLLVRGAYVVTMDGRRRMLPRGAVAVIKDEIAAVGSDEEILSRYSAERTIDAEGKFLFPGFVSTHTHLFQTMLKGLGRDKGLFDWLDSSVRRAYHLFDGETIRYAALTGLIEAVRSGTTTVTDFQYCHPEPGIDRSVIGAYEALGVRGVLSKAHSDVSGLPEEIRPKYVESEEDFLRETEELCREYSDHPLVSMSVAPGIIWDVSAAGYERVREIADRWSVPITMHLMETPDDNQYARETYGKSCIEFLEERGVLGPDFVAVHAVHVDEEETEILRRNGVTVAHCPVSNMILASGIAPVRRYVQRGIPVSLACDGAASNDTQNMLEVLKTTALLQKVAEGDAAAVSAAQVLEMATLGGARALGMEEKLGSLEPGKKADFFIYDPLRAASVPAHDPVATLVYSADPSGVETTVIGGRPVLENGRLNGADERETLRRARQLAGGLVRAAGLGNVQWNQPVRPGTE